MLNYLSHLSFFQLFSRQASKSFLPRISCSQLFCLLSIFIASSSHGQLIDATVQEQLDTIARYYEIVQEQLPNPGREQESNLEFVPDLLPIQPNAINSSVVSSAAAYTPAGRDPFAITPIMLQNENFSLRQPVNFTPLDGNIKIPNLYLKGIITGNGGEEMSALLEIEGMGVFVVHEGDSVGLYGLGNNRDVIQIESISRLSLIVRTGTIGGNANKRFVVR